MTALLAAFALLTAAPDASTQAAKELVQEGQKLFGQGRFLEAVEKFESAQAVKPHPGLHFNIARCHEELGNTGKALKSYREYLRYMPKVDDRSQVEKAMAALQKKLADSGVEQLRVVVVPSTASIFIDGAPGGPSPAYVEVKPGAHTVSASQSGYVRQEKQLDVQLGTLPEVTLDLVRVTDEPPATPPLVTPPQPSLVPEEDFKKPPEPTPLATETRPAEVKPKGRTVTWVLLGTGIVAAGTGLGFGLGANAASVELHIKPHPTAEANRLVQQTQAFSTTANIAWGVAGAAAIATVIAFFVEGAAQ